MGKFEDALNGVLPSKANTITESAEDNTVPVDGPEGTVENVDDENLENIMDGEGNGEDIGPDDIEDVGENEDDLESMLGGLSDEELDELEKQLSDEAIDGVIDDEDDDEEDVELSADEEVKADDMMKMAATTLLVNDELNAEEKVEFVKSKEAEIVVNEGFMTESDVNSLAAAVEAIPTDDVVTEAKYTKKMIIRLDAQSKMKQLKALAINISAAAHNDPDYKKLKKVMRMRKILRKKLAKKYNAEANKRMKVYFMRLKNSKSKVLSNIGKKNS